MEIWLSVFSREANEMKRIRLVLYSSLSLIIFVAAGAAANPLLENGPDLETMARGFVSTWSGGDYEGATATFDKTMRGAMPPEMMEKTWDGLIDRMGDFKEIAGARSEKWEDSDIVFVTCIFANGPVDIKLVYNSDQKISGLWFVPTQSPADVEKTDKGSGTETDYPAYADQSTFEESSVTVGSGEWELPGTLAVPKGKGPFPAVLLVYGSGPNDRDETIGPNKPFRDIAWGLASRGVAVLRYDKRTKTHGMRMAMDKVELTVKEEAIDDAVTAVRQLRETDRIDPGRVFVLGHSLGGMLAPRIGAREPRVAGLIVIAGATRPLEDLTIEQYRYIFSLDGEISAQEQTQLDTLVAQAARVKDPALSADTPAELLLFGVSAPYWIDLQDYDPVETASELDMPMLILQGERDYQVTMEDLARWQSLLPSPRIECKSYPRLNHLFITGEGRSVPAEYGTAGHVAVEVIDDIAGWCDRH